MVKTAEKPTLSFAAAFAQLRKKYGSNTIMLADTMSNIDRIPCGIPSLDFQLGGGFPMGRIIHIAGEMHAGKTFLAMMIAASLQRTYGDKQVFWLDVERSFDPIRAEQVGVDLSRLIVARPSSCEVGLDELIGMAPYLCGGVIDSVAALSTVAEAEGTMGDKQVGAVAALMAKFFHKWISDTSSEKLEGAETPMLVLTNQLRDDIGSYIKKTKTPGGRGVLHYPSVFVEVSRGPVVKLKEHDAEDEEVVVGHDIKFNIRKNNTFAPDKKGAFMLCTRPYNFGAYSIQVNNVDWSKDLLKYAVHYEIIKKAGSWLEFGENKWQGKMEAQAALFNDGEMAGEVNKLIMAEVKRQHGVKTNGAEKKVEAAGKKLGKAASGAHKRWVRK